eukprot:2717232-Rhodomonas_salina.1
MSPTASVTLAPHRLNLMSPLWSVPVCTGRGRSPCLVSTETQASESLAISAQVCTTDSCPLCHAVLPCIPHA